MQDSFRRHLFDVPFDISFYRGFILHSGGLSVEDERLRVTAPRDEPGAFCTEWWFWTAVSAVAVGAAATTSYFVLRDDTLVLRVPD